MNYKNILVPFDGSDHSIRALHEAMELAVGQDETTIRVVKIVDAKTIDQAIVSSGVATSDVASAGSYSSRYDLETYKRYIKAGRKWLEEQLDAEVAGVIGDYEGNVETALVEGGSPGRTIVDFGKEHHCDIIIMGRRGLGAFRGMLGSVSFSVLHGADVPVLTVK